MTPFAGHPSLTLLPEGAIYLTDSRTLVLADLHLGKSAAFRAKGLPVPEGDTARDLGRVRALVEKLDAHRIVVAGDLFHAPSGITPELEVELDDFLNAIRIPVILVLGNHDEKLRVIPPRLESARELDLGENLRVVHDPADARGGSLHLCGHLHPIVKIPDGKRTSLRFPCFFNQGNRLVLPAFGTFTGGAVVHPRPEDRVFVALRDQMIELSKIFS
jgi:DNA ligase-associated metallophosphoesterase